MVALTCERQIPSSDVSTTEDAAAETQEFLLVCEAIRTSDTHGSWRFCLETANGSPLLDVSEQEQADGNRLALLSVVRGLEALDEPGIVTLISTSRYVIRGLRDSLHRWRKNGFVGEIFGRVTPIPHVDLWRRIDHAISFHQVNACLLSATQISGNRPASVVLSKPETNNTATSAIAGSPNPSYSVNRSDGAADRLRRWLLAQCSVGAQVPRRRYGRADFAIA